MVVFENEKREVKDKKRKEGEGKKGRRKEGKEKSDLALSHPAE